MEVMICANVKEPCSTPAWYDSEAEGIPMSKERSCSTMYDWSEAICQKSTSRDSPRIARARLFGMLSHVGSNSLASSLELSTLYVGPFGSVIMIVGVV